MGTISMMVAAGWITPPMVLILTSLMMPRTGARITVRFAVSALAITFSRDCDSSLSTRPSSALASARYFPSRSEI